MTLFTQMGMYATTYDAKCLSYFVVCRYDVAVAATAMTTTTKAVMVVVLSLFCVVRPSTANDNYNCYAITRVITVKSINLNCMHEHTHTYMQTHGLIGWTGSSNRSCGNLNEFSMVSVIYLSNSMPENYFRKTETNSSRCAIGERYHKRKWFGDNFNFLNWIYWSNLFYVACCNRWRRQRQRRRRREESKPIFIISCT